MKNQKGYQVQQAEIQVTRCDSVHANSAVVIAEPDTKNCRNRLNGRQPALKGKKHYSCNTCEKTFSGIGALKRHNRIHTGERHHLPKGFHTEIPFDGTPENTQWRKAFLLQHLSEGFHQ